MAISLDGIRRLNLNLDIKDAFKRFAALVDGSVAATKAAPVTRTVTATATITAADHDATIFLNNATGFVTTLPDPATVPVGFRVRFINKLANTSGNHTIVTAASANIIVGALVDAAAGAGDTGTADDTINFVANQSTAGDRVDLTTDGVSWFATAITKIVAAMTFTTAS